MTVLWLLRLHYCHITITVCLKRLTYKWISAYGLCSELFSSSHETIDTAVQSCHFDCLVSAWVFSFSQESKSNQNGASISLVQVCLRDFTESTLGCFSDGWELSYFALDISGRKGIIHTPALNGDGRKSERLPLSIVHCLTLLNQSKCQRSYRRSHYVVFTNNHS